MSDMFEDTKSFNQDLSDWDVSKVTNFKSMFSGSQFAGDISGWKLNRNVKRSKKGMAAMFDNSALQKSGELPAWYTEVYK